MIAQWVNTPNSSNVEGFGFDTDTKEIVVRFNNGAMYAYDTAKTIFSRMLDAESKGKFVNEVLKGGGFTYRRIDNG